MKGIFNKLFGKSTQQIAETQGEIKPQKTLWSPINYNLLFDLNYTILRYPTAYGPRSRNVDAISIFVDSAIKNKNLIIYGNGKQRRNYLHVEDFLIYVAIL